MEIGLHVIRERHRPRKEGKKGAPNESLSRLPSSDPQQEINWSNSIFRNCDGINRSEEPEVPLFTSTTKKEAFKELKASLDLSSPTTNRDLKSLERAWEDFKGKGSLKANGKGEWSVKGMKSCLRHYQVVGVAFLRRRENGIHPHGGLEADVMGLGSK